MSDAMSYPGTKDELLAFMQSYWDGFVAASDALADHVWLEPVDASGWNVRDHVSHVVVWVGAEAELFATGTPIQESIGMPEEIWASEDADERNEWIRQTRADASPTELRAERDRVFPKLLESVSNLSEAELSQPARVSGLETSDRPLLLVISEYCGLHYDDHREQIELLGMAGA